MIQGAHHTETAKPQFTIDPDGTAFDASNHIIGIYIAVARANEGGVILGDDTKYLHNYRIALRKIRSVLSLFKGVYGESQIAGMKDRFSDLMISTGRLRDLDVYLMHKAQYFALLPKALHEGLALMFEMFAEERRGEQARLTRRLKSKRYEVEISSLAKQFAQRKKLKQGHNADVSVRNFATALIWKQYKRIGAAAGGIGPTTTDAEVHTLRINCKKLRYLMEFFGPLFPRSMLKALLKPLKLLQDNLGQFNDYSTQQLSLQKFLRGRINSPDGIDLKVVQSVGALTAVLQVLQNKERAKIFESFALLGSAETGKKFRDLFHDQKEKKRSFQVCSPNMAHRPFN